MKTKFLNFIKNLSYKDWLLIIISILAIIFFILYRYYLNKCLYNTVIYNDTLLVYKNKLNEEYKSKNTYVLTIDLLKENNSDLYNEVKSLKDNPILITKTTTKFSIDTIHAKSDTIIINKYDNLTNYLLKWHAADKDSLYYSLYGFTNVLSDFTKFNTTITNLTVNNDITLDLIDNGKNLQVIAKSSNPYININDINSVVIDPTKSKTLSSYFKLKKWSIGPYIGVGLDLRSFQVSPLIGVGLTYGIFKF